MKYASWGYLLLRKRAFHLTKCVFLVHRNWNSAGYWLRTPTAYRRSSHDLLSRQLREKRNVIYRKMIYKILSYVRVSWTHVVFRSAYLFHLRLEILGTLTPLKPICHHHTYLMGTDYFLYSSIPTVCKISYRSGEHESSASHQKKYAAWLGKPQTQREVRAH